MGLLSGLCSVVSSACSAVGSLFSGSLSVIGKIFIPEIQLVINAISIVARVIATVCKALGIWKDDVEPEELGDKAIQGAEAGITRDKFETYDEYLKKIHEFKLDPEKSAQIPLEAKLAAATTIGVMGIEKHYHKGPGSLASLISIVGKNADFFDAGRIRSYLDAGIDISALRGYLDRSASAGSNIALLKSVLDSERTLTGKSDAEIYKGLDEAMRRWKENK